MKKFNKQKDLNVQQDKILYIGTNEQTAKLAPAKGLMAPIFLTDVYPGFFCKETCKNEGERWGIISVSTSKLNLDMFAPSPAFMNKKDKRNISIDDVANYKSKWEKSLIESGTCVYLSSIPSDAIQKIMIYNPSGKHTNIVINKLINELPTPTSSLSEHKTNYPKSLGVSRWLNGEEVRCEDIFNGDTNIKLINETEEKLANRFGLDVYYLKPEEKGKKHAAKSSFNA